MSAIFNQIGLAVRTKFEENEAYFQGELVDKHNDFELGSTIELPGAQATSISLMEGTRDGIIAKSTEAMNAHSAAIITKGNEIKSLLSDDNIINVFAELQTKLDEQGEELAKRIDEYNTDLAVMAAQRKAEIGFEDAVVVAAMATITTAIDGLQS
jgi:hypothetical protein